METIVEIKPGQRVYEYLLVLSPPEELWNRIMGLKQNFAEKYKSDHARWGKPHVYLANFLLYEMKEERVISFLKRIAMSYVPFKVEMKDFGTDSSSMIYINVDSQLAVPKLVTQIRSEGKTLMSLDEEIKPHFYKESDITIGRKLTPSQYEKAWQEYSKARFSGRFIAGGMALLKRPADELQYHIAAKFEFESLPVVTKEGKLDFLV